MKQTLMRAMRSTKHFVRRSKCHSTGAQHSKWNRWTLKLNLTMELRFDFGEWWPFLLLFELTPMMRATSELDWWKWWILFPLKEVKIIRKIALHQWKIIELVHHRNRERKKSCRILIMNLILPLYFCLFSIRVHKKKSELGLNSKC